MTADKLRRQLLARTLAAPGSKMSHRRKPSGRGPAAITPNRKCHEYNDTPAAGTEPKP